VTDIARLTAALAGRYRLERELGQGGMATVYLAEDLRHQRKVALKVLRPELSAVLGGERFLKEITVTAGLQHPHILQLYDSGDADGLLYYVMPYVEGASLRDRLKRERQLSVEEAIRVTGIIAGALDFAHKRGIVHRDIKPENILFQEDVPLVADFGIAVAVTTAGGDRLTATGLSLGTPAYMSPEQIAGERVLDARSDVYALACVTYEMLAGDPPFLGSSAQAVMAKHVTDVAPPITTTRPNAGAQVAAALAKALSKAPADRYARAGAFAEGLTARAPAEEPAKPALVVLPFANRSPDPENEYFADGLTEEIIAGLASVAALSVISRTSSMRLKGTDMDVRAIGRELGVRYVLEGSVRKAGQSLRITTQLVDARTDEPLWAEKYNGTMDDVFEVQERVAREIVRALDVKLTTAEDRRLRERPIADARAFELFLQARQEIRRFGPPVQRGLALLARVREIEGDTIPLRALEALGQIYLVRSGLAADRGPLDAAERLARSILAEAPDHGYARGLIALAEYERTGSAHVATLVPHFEAALDQNPNDPDFLFAIGVTYLGAGLTDQTGEAARRYLACDPLAGLAWLLAGVQHWFVGRPAESLTPLHRALELDPGNPMAHWCAGYTYALCGQLAEAKQQAETMRATAAGFLYTGQLLGLIAALEGNGERALAHVRDVPPLDGHHRFHLAETRAMAGDVDGAFALLEESVAWFHPAPYIRTHCPFLAPLRGTSRFAAYAERAEAFTAVAVKAFADAS